MGHCGIQRCLWECCECVCDGCAEEALIEERAASEEVARWCAMCRERECAPDSLYCAECEREDAEIRAAEGGR